ncbi:MFS transporter [Lactobacillus sp. ESL0791]|uniref:MFS transporter n=1 Tax=Lactobacillus sp. ESL0791 TaxID=2983234 RepID=UPI0023F70F2A|nr:MFS transporter [Lactobacillus sp. ESL0791]MDF7639871.1 MFS transporter [Lactobacillus sp. ESL0791]
MDIFLKNKNYRKVTFASWLSSAGDTLFYLALMTYASNLKNYALALSLISISESVPRLIESLSGYFADKTQNKFKMIIWLAVIRFVLYMIVGGLFASNLAGWNLVLMVIGINFISDISGMYSGGLQTPIIVDLVGENEIAEAEGFTGGISSMITLVAQFAGSGLLLIMSYSTLAIVNALTFLAAGLLFANVAVSYRKEHYAQTSQETNDKNFGTTIAYAFKQVKKASGLLTIVLVVALMNGILDTIEPLTTIVIAGNKQTMALGSYSFTIALIGAVASIGIALGSAVGTKIFKKTSIFAISLADIIFAAAALFAVICRSIIMFIVFLAFLGFFAGTASPKLTQWLVTAVDRNILASSIGLLNTILAMVGPLMTTIFTSIAGTINVDYALYGVLITSVAVFGITLITMIKTKKNN